MAEKIDYDKTHRQNLSVVAVHIDKIFKEAAQEAAKIGVSLHKTLPDGKIFSFADYPETKKQIDRLIEDLKQNLTTITVNGIRSAWTLSNNKNNALSRRIFGDNVGKLSQIQYRRYFTNNAQALDAFIARKTNGLNLSDRVWKYTDEFKHEIELGLDIGIRNGLSASKMARDLQQYLQFPDKLFRRIRDEHGSLQLSKAAKAFHPGQGVYRSSYKNARRLAVTETNIAYRTADHLRWQSMDFVIGVEVKLSGNHTCLGRDGKPHPFYDICDELKGTYPKGFKFTGWHPQCRCYAVPKLADQDEFMEHVRNMGTDGGDESYSGEVTDVPDNFKEWAKDNKDRIEQSGKRGTLPYFIKDNKDRVNQILDGGKMRDDQTTLVTVRIDANRRLYEQLKANPNYIDVDFNPGTGGLKATHKGHVIHNKKTDPRFFYPENLTSTDLEKLCQKELFEIGNTCILLQENVKTSDGYILPALDAEIDGKLMDIRSVTVNKGHYGAAIKAKIKQLSNFNTKTNDNADAICLYFNDPAMYTDGCIERGIEWIKHKFGDITPLKEVWIVIRGEGLKIISV